MRRPLVALLFAALSSVAASPALALTATFDWVNTGGSNGSGYVTFDSASITDPANFGSPVSGLPLAALVDLSYTWSYGSTTRTISEADVSFWQLPFGFSAANGFLTTQANGSDWPTNSFSLQFAPYPADSRLSLAPDGLDVDTGYWQLRPIPEPATVLLLAAGLIGLGAFAWMRRGGAMGVPG